jgi:hypothetical protein
MRGKRIAASQATEVYDSTYSSAPRGTGKVVRGYPVLFLERLGTPHGMNEIVGLIHAGQSGIESFRGKDIPGNNFGGLADTGPEILRTTREAADPVAFCFQNHQQASTDVSACAGYENEITIHLLCRS